MHELACFLSPLVVDVVLFVTKQRQVLFVLTVEVPQIQLFVVVGFRFLGMWVYIDQPLRSPWSCKGRYQLLSGAYGGRGRIPHISFAQSRAVRTWTQDFISTSSLYLAGTRPDGHAPVNGGFWKNFSYYPRGDCARAVRTWKSGHYFLVLSLVGLFLRNAWLDSGYMYLTLHTSFFSSSLHIQLHAYHTA